MLLLAGSNAEAAELSRRVQTRLIQLGTVGRPQAALSDGNHAGVGDLVRARLNTKIDAAGRPLTNAGFRTGCSPPDSDDFEAERRHWAATSWPGGRADTANASLFSCGTVLATDARLGTCHADSHPSGVIQIGAFRSQPSATPGWQSSSRADPSSVPAPGRTPGRGLMSGKTPGPKCAPVRHGGVEVAARKSALTTTLPLFLLFAAAHFAMQRASPANFTTHSLTRTDACTSRLPRSAPWVPGHHGDQPDRQARGHRPDDPRPAGGGPGHPRVHRSRAARPAGASGPADPVTAPEQPRQQPG